MSAYKARRGDFDDQSATTTKQDKASAKKSEQGAADKALKTMAEIADKEGRTDPNVMKTFKKK